MIILDEDIYRSHSALNYSSAKSLLKSPKHFQASLKRKVEPSQEMLMGTAIHEAVLEGKSPSYIVRPEGMNGRTKEGKEWKAQNAGKIILSQEEDAGVRNAIKAVRENADVQYLLSLCKQREIGIVHNYNGVEIKGRLDAHGQDEAGKPIILDFKTTSDAEPESWGKKAFGLRYPMQSAWYQSLLALELGLEDPAAYFWLVVETQEPFDVAIYQPPEEALEIGRAQMNHCIEAYKSCVASGKWPGYGKGIIQLEVPPWERKRWLKQ
jgi:hypothetical protein